MGESHETCHTYPGHISLKSNEKVSLKLYFT